MIRQLTPEMLEGWVAQLGGTEFEVRGPDFCSFRSPMGERIQLILYGPPTAFDALQVRCGWNQSRTDESNMLAALQIIDRWNRVRRIGKGYLDREGDPVVEFELDVEGGVAEENITAFLRRPLGETPRFAFEVVEPLNEI
jgi:hypothetical protein